MYSPNFPGCLGVWSLMAILVYSPSAWAQTRIDLEVVSIAVRLARAKNENVVITAIVRNNGTETAEQVDLKLDLLKNGKRYKSIEDIPVLSHLPRLGSGLSIPVSLDPLPSGKYEAVMKVDPKNKIHETEEKNNEKSIHFEIR